MKYLNFTFVAVAIIVFVSCGSTRDIVYMQDMSAGLQIEAAAGEHLKARPDDELTIVVTCDKPVLASVFNLPYVTNRIGVNSGGSASESATGSLSGDNGILSYTVDKSGDIDFPMFGKLHVAGLERTEIAMHIKQMLIDSNQLKNPVVVVEFTNHFVTVVGEVGHPGRFFLNRDKTTLLDIIGQAGDLTINGRRQPVKVLRRNGESWQVIETDLTKGYELFKSPAFYVQPNDIVYIEPNNKRRNDSTVNNNTLQSPSFWLSLGSFLLTLGVLVFK